jgi:DNA-directed RNA polymerase subunit RPC12/RpoP
MENYAKFKKNLTESHAYQCATCGERLEHEEYEENPRRKCSNCGDNHWIIEESSDENVNALDGMSVQKARTFLHKNLDMLTKGRFNDTAWENVTKIFRRIDELGIERGDQNSEYDNETPPRWKRWSFELMFNDNRGKRQKLYGNLTAGGCGTVEDPLGTYDLTLYFT